MTDGEDTSTFDGSSRRRTVMKALAAAGGFGQFQGLAGAEGSASNDESTLFSKAADEGWRLTWRDKLSYTDSRDRSHRVKSYHDLLYLGFEWDDYGDPTTPGVEGGAWKHTFLLNSMGTHAYTKYEDSTSDDPTVHPGYTPKRSYVEVDVDHDTSDDSDGDNLAVSVRKDANLFGFIKPEAFDAIYDEDFSYESDDGTTGTSGLSDAYYGFEETDKPDRVGLNDNHQRYLEAKSKEQVEDGFDALWGTMSLLLSYYLCASANAVCAAVIMVASLAKQLMSYLEPRDPVRFENGFYKEYIPENWGYGIGHYMLFDVYVPPGVDGTFTLRSMHYMVGPSFPSFTWDSEYVIPDDVEATKTRYGFDPHAQWQFDVHGATQPEEVAAGAMGTSPSAMSGPDRFDVKPIPPEESNVTSVPVSLTTDEKPPTARLDFGPKLPVPGDEVSFDASDSTNPDGGDLTYEWTVEKAASPPEEIDPELEGETAERTFESGRYQVAVTVVDEARGLRDTASTWLNVENRSVKDAIAGRDGVLEREDVKQAEQLWANDEVVPGTVDKTVTTELLQEMRTKVNDAFDLYENDTPWGRL